MSVGPFHRRHSSGALHKNTFAPDRRFGYKEPEFKGPAALAFPDEGTTLIKNGITWKVVKAISGRKPNEFTVIAVSEPDPNDWPAFRKPPQRRVFNRSQWLELIDGADHVRPKGGKR